MFTQKTTLLALFTLSLTFSALGQESRKSLTNGDIVTMMKGGVPEDTIIIAITASPGTYDVSPAALIELKNQGATEKILNAVVTASGTRGAVNNERPGASLDAAMAMYTVTFIDGTNRIPMKQAAARSQTHVRALGYGGGSVTNELASGRSDFRTKNPQPQFEVNLLSSLRANEHLFLVKLTVKSDKREIQTGNMKSVFGSLSSGFRKEDIIPISISDSASKNLSGMQYTAYVFKPTSPLRTGEYAVSFQGTYYDFGVDVGK